MRPTLLLLTIFLSATAFVFGQKSDAIFQYAAELMAKGEYELAIQQYKLAEDVDHGNIHAKIGIAEAYYFLENFEETLGHLEGIGPMGRYPKADYIKGLVLFKLENYEKARTLLGSALIKEVIDDKLPYYLAVCYYKMGYIDEAIDQLKLLIQDTVPDHAYSHFYIGQAYLEKDTLELALHYAKRATELAETTPRMWRGLADVEFSMENIDAAIMNYGKALRLNPNYEEARLRRGIAYFENGIYTLAKSDLEKVVNLNSRDELALNTLLDCYYALNEYEKFLNTVDRLCELDPGASELLFKRGYMHFANEKFDLAIDDFEILADLYPEDNSIHHELGNCYSRKKDYSNAIYHYQLASEGSRGSDISRYNLAVTYFESDRISEACEIWKFLIGNTKDPSIKSNCETFNNNYCR